MQQNSPELVLSVALPVYNHETFIAKAIESILTQKTNFEYEIVIGDDCSTDSTRRILLAYCHKYPGRMKLILPEKNQGALRNAQEIYRNCRGKYIAILEGDDYWTNENKLQLQIDFLDKNQDYAGCFHDAAVISCVDKCNPPEIATGHHYAEYRYYSQFNKYRSDIYSWDLLKRTIIPTGSLVFRNSDLGTFFKEFRDIELSLQWALHLYIIRNSKFRYFNECWSVYNDHPEGVTKTREVFAFNRSNIRILKFLRRDTYYKTLKPDVKRALLEEYRQILYNKKSYEKPFGFFLKYFLAFIGSSFNLFFAEILLFLGRRLKK